MTIETSNLLTDLSARIRQASDRAKASSREAAAHRRIAPIFTILHILAPAMMGAS